MKYYLGIDLGGTNIKAGVTDEAGTILVKQSVKTGAFREADRIISDMADLCRSVCNEAGIHLQQVESVGIGVPGTVDNKTGTVLYTNNLNLSGVPLAKKMEEHLGKKIYLSNDANCAALGEFIGGSAKEFNSIVMVTLGTGVGGGIILNGKLWDGLEGSGTEIGHMVIHIGGEPCTCGRSGCWEAYSSASALVRDANRAMETHPESLLCRIAKEKGRVSAKSVFRAAKEGDAVASELVESYLFHLSEGIANIINILAPEAVVLGGGVCNEGDALLIPLKELTYQKCYGGTAQPHSRITVATLGNDAGIVGAAMLWNA